MNGNGHNGNGTKIPEENKIEEKPQEENKIEENIPAEENKIEESEGVSEKKKSHFWDYFFTVLFLLIVIAAMVYVSAQKKPEPLTELYFEDYKNLPEYSNGVIDFKFVIHNIEGKDIDYNVEVAVEINGKKTIMDGFQAKLKDNEKKVIYEKLNITDFKKARVIVSLVNKNQDIYFWTNYAKEVLHYENLGGGVLDCLPTIKTRETDKIVINARGDYAQAWPIVTLYVDGKKIEDVEIDSVAYKSYVVAYKLDKGPHVIDVLFNNDYYNSKTKEDRNLYISSVGVGITTIKPQDAIINIGKDNEAFNCVKTKKDGFMTGNGAFRFKVEVQ